MNYITIVAPTYDEAVRKAREQYGERLRIHSRKDVVGSGFLGLRKTKRCELTCFLSEAVSQEPSSTPNKDEDELLLERFEKEARTPDPEKKVVAKPPVTPKAVEPVVVEEVAPKAETKDEDLLKPLLDKAEKILRQNDFTYSYSDWLLSDIRSQLSEALPVLPSDEEFELLVIDHIVGSVEIDHNSQLHPPRVFVVVGPTGIGKTTTIAKIAALYGTIPPVEIRKKVRIITLDSFRVGAYDQMVSFGKALGIPVSKADDEEQFFAALEEAKDDELVLIDTIGKSPRDNELSVKLQTLMKVPDKKQTKFYLAVSASMKEIDIDKVFEQFASFGISSVIVTKTDETQTIGNIISICHDKGLPLLFVTDGQKVPRDIHKASSAFMLSLLRGFSMDFTALWNTQIGSDE